MKGKTSVWNYIQHYKFKSVFIKYFTIAVVLFVLPITIISSIIYRNDNLLLENEVKDVSLNSLYRIMEITDAIFEQAGTISAKISIDPNVDLFLRSPQYNNLRSNVQKNISDMIISYSYIFKAVESIYVYSETNELIMTNTTTMKFSDFEDDTWYEGYKARANDGQWMEARRFAGVYPVYISIFNPAYIHSDPKYGVVVMNISVDSIKKIIAGNAKNNDSVFILDKNNHILFSKDAEIIGKNASEIKILSKILEEDRGQAVIKKIDGKEYIVSLLNSPFQDNKYISVVPLLDFGERFSRIRDFVMTVLIIGIVFAIISSVIISIKSYKPLESIISLMESPEVYLQGRAVNGRRTADETAGNEIKYILNNISTTLLKNNQQESELKVRLDMLNRSQIAMLLAQINPHFLYNTLETINIKAIRLLDHNNEVSDAITALSDLLRLSLENDKHLTTVAEEIEHAKLYVKIMGMRYENKFSVAWNMDDDILECLIVKICLQPLIENSILHGIKPKRNKMNITVTGKALGEDILIEVVDDGAGIPAETVLEINRLLDMNIMDGRNIGLKNVNQRIKLIFGETYGLTLFSEVDKGTAARMLMPGKR